MNLEPVRAARLLVLATRLAKPRTLAASEGPLHKVADSYSAKLSVAIRYAFASARNRMRRELHTTDDVKRATALGIVVLRQELKEVLPKILRKMYVEGGEVGAEILAKQLRVAEWNEAEHPRGESGKFSSSGEAPNGARWISDPDVADEHVRAFQKSVAKLPAKLFRPGGLGSLHSSSMKVVSDLKPYGHSHAAGEVHGVREGQSILVKAGPDQEMVLFHEVGHIEVGHLANRDSVKSAFKSDTTRKIKGQLSYYASDIKEALAQSYGYHLGGRDENYEKFVKAFPKVHEEVGKRTARTRALEFRTLKREFPSTRLGFRFDVTDEAAVSWADKHAAELIDGISETSREDINNAVAEFLETGDFKELKDEILAAVGDVARAERIARNEPMVAVHDGQRAAWNQAVEEGLLPEDAVREWIVVGDDKVCPICEALEGKTAALGEEYEEGIEGPPAHVMCRCSESISSFKSLGGPGSGNFGHAGRPGEVGGSSSDGSPEANSPEEVQKLIEEEQRKYLTPEEYERLPPGIRAWKTRTRKEKAEGKEPPKPEVKKPEVKKEEPKTIATKDREEAINKRADEIYKLPRDQGGKPWMDARDQARAEDEAKHGPLPANSLDKRREAINKRTDEIRRELGAKLEAEGKSKEGLYEKAYKLAQKEDAQKWGPFAHPEEVEAIRASDKKWSPSQVLAEREAKFDQSGGKIEREVIDPEHQSAKQIQVRGAADEVARSMNFDPALIAVRDRGNSPRTFELNGKKLTEGGHYNPQTGRIEVNAQFGVDRGLIVHEIQHAQWDYVNSQAKFEQSALRDRWAREQAADFTGTSYFLKNGKIQAKYRDEFEKQMPHTSVLARAGLGSKELGIKADIEGMKFDDGVSNYSREYWTKAEKERGFDLRSHTTNYVGELAVNETLSEVARRVRGHSEFSDTNYQLAPRFVKLNKDLEALYSKDLNKVQRFFRKR